MTYQYVLFQASSPPTGLCVPQFTVAVVATAQELGAVVVEADVAHGLLVSQVRLDTAPVVVHLPDLRRDVKGWRESLTEMAKTSDLDPHN